MKEKRRPIVRFQSGPPRPVRYNPLMANKAEKDDFFEWDIGGQGFDDSKAIPEPEPVHPAEQPAAPSKRPWSHRRTLWMRAALAAIIVLILGGLWLLDWWSQRQTGADIERLLALDKSTPLAPVGGLTPLPILPVLRSMEVTGPDNVRADMAYAFSAPDGAVLNFAVPRFFERKDGAWSPVRVPGDFPGETLSYNGVRLILKYPAADADFVENTLGPFVDDVLVSACKQWQCSAGARAQIELDVAWGRPPSTPELPADDSLLFTLLAAGDLPRGIGAHRRPAFFLTGYPVGANSVAYLRRAFALQALTQLALSIDPQSYAAQSGPSPMENNPFLYAVVARMGARLELESPNALAPQPPEALAPLEQMWNWNSIENAEARRGRARASRTALAILNELLRDQPVEVEAEILHGQIPGGDSLAAFAALYGALAERGLTVEEMGARVQAALGQPGNTDLSFLRDAELVLNCETGPLFLTSDGQFHRLPLPEGFPVFAWVPEWSPDGRRIAVNFFLHSFVADLETAQTQWTPGIEGNAIMWSVGWASDSVLAYYHFRFPRPAEEFDLTSVELRFADLDDPTRSPPALPGVWIPGSFPGSQPNAGISPDRTAFLVTNQPFAEGSGEFSVMPILGGERTTVGAGTSPAWSPDSRSVAYVSQDQGERALTLKVFDRETGAQRTLPLGQQEQFIYDANGGSFSQLKWSPTGEQIAFVLGSSGSRGSTAWLGLARLDGSESFTITQSLEFIGQMNFSPDGRYLAVTFPDDRQPRLAIYETQRGELVRSLAGQWRNAQWSPGGDALWLFSDNGVQHLDQPLLRQSQPHEVTQGACQNALWKP